MSRAEEPNLGENSTKFRKLERKMIFQAIKLASSTSQSTLIADDSNKGDSWNIITN